MRLISHRKNLISELVDSPQQHGVEVDVRSQGDRLVLHHDPFEAGEDFRSWLESYAHGTLILNVKEEGLEDRCLSLMNEFGVADFFFLDQSFPFLIKTSKTGERRSAIRYSEFEPLDYALSLAGKVDWVWVDCFSHFPLTADSARRLCEAGFKLCLVSPELQGRWNTQEIEDMKRTIALGDMNIAAICTKVPDVWFAS